MILSREKGRQSALNLIKASPGITSAQIRSHIDPKGAYDRCIVAHNLTRLFREGLVTRVRVTTNRAVAYAYTATAAAFSERKGMKQTTKDRLIDLIKRNPGLIARQLRKLASEEGIPTQSIDTQLSTMASKGLVSRTNSDLQGLSVFAYWPLASIDEAPSWTGEGLPPVDAVCEVTTPAMDGTRIKVTIKYVGETRIIAHDGRDERCWLISHCTFYPISTTEQIAADERQKEVIAIGDILIANRGASTEYHQAGLIYDAGYRKQVPPVVEEDTSDIDYSIKIGDTVQTDHWEHSSLEVVDVNWALCAVAVRLGPTGGIVVWPARGMKKVAP